MKDILRIISNTKSNMVRHGLSDFTLKWILIEFARLSFWSW